MGEDHGLTLESWVARGWRAFTTNPVHLLGGAMILSLASLVPSVLWAELTLRSFLMSLCWGFVVGAPLHVGWYYLCIRTVRGEEGTMSDVFWGFYRWGAAMFTNLLYHLVITGGIILCVIPGIIWAVKYCFNLWTVLDKGMSGKQALRFSGELTRGYRTRLLFLGLLVMLPGILWSGFAASRFQGAAEMAPSNGGLVSSSGFLSFLVGLVVTVLTGVCFAAAYETLLAHQRNARLTEEPREQSLESKELTHGT